MKSKIVLALHLSTDKIIPISVAKNGLACECVCEECKQPLEAIQGKINEWHFRHVVDSNCKGGYESALHKMGKQIIADNSEMAIPKYGIIHYSNPKQEKTYEKIKRPDVSAYIGNAQLFFEVIVNNPVEPDKELLYKEKEIKSIAINLKDYTFTTKEALEIEILNKTERKKIIYWEKEAIAAVRKTTSNFGDIIFGAIVVLGIIWLISTLFGNKRRLAFK